MARTTNIKVPYQIIAMFGPDPMYGNGKDEVRYYCPECEVRHGSVDRKGKLYVNTKTLKYHCFRCGYAGQIGRHLKANESRIYDEDKEKDIEELVHSINLVTDESPTSQFDLKIPIEKIFDSDTAVKYLLNRGFSEDQLEYYDMRIGNINSEFGRIIIPNQVDKIVYTDYYSARTFIDQTPKYHNPAKDKSDIVFNLHRVKEGEPIIVVEGVLTAIAAGYHAVSTLGKTITRSQASQIIKKHPSVVYVNYDYGAEEFSERACQLLKSISPDIKIMEVLMKDDRDAADLTHEEYTACLSQAVEYNSQLRDINKLLEDI